MQNNTKKDKLMEIVNQVLSLPVVGNEEVCFQIKKFGCEQQNLAVLKKREQSIRRQLDRLNIVRASIVAKNFKVSIASRRRNIYNRNKNIHPRNNSLGHR